MVDYEELPVVESAAEEDEAEKPKKARGGRGWVYGAAGMVAGSALSILLMVFNLLPVDTLKDMVGTSEKKPAATVAPAPAPAAVQPAPVAAAVVRNAAKAGTRRRRSWRAWA